TDLINKKSNNVELFDDNFIALVELLQDQKVYEVGFEFGQRLDYLENNGVSVIGGIEFNPIFGLYSKHYDLYGNKKNGKWDIRFIDINFWQPSKRDIVFTNHFLDQLDPNDVEIVLNKLVQSTQTLYMNENLELEFPKQEG